MQFYNIKDWPYVAVIDPITGSNLEYIHWHKINKRITIMYSKIINCLLLGENMVVWNKLDCNTFCELGMYQNLYIY